MSTNYFNPISYATRQPTRTEVQLPTLAPLPAANPAWTTVTGWSPNGPVSAQNQPFIARLLEGLYGSALVPGVNQRAATAYGQARNNARDMLRGYGGVSFRNDDPSTPDVDESLMADYQPDKVGTRERQAVLAARAQANARGMMNSGFGDQMIGSALQRVSEDARQIVNQYATQINQISREYFHPVHGEVAQTLGQIETLYGADARWALEQEGLKPASTETPTTYPMPAVIPGSPGGTVDPNWKPPEYPNQAPGTWTSPPNPAELDRRFGKNRWMRYYDFKTKRWTVRTR